MDDLWEELGELVSRITDSESPRSEWLAALLAVLRMSNLRDAPSAVEFALACHPDGDPSPQGPLCETDRLLGDAIARAVRTAVAIRDRRPFARRRLDRLRNAVMRLEARVIHNH